MELKHKQRIFLSIFFFLSGFCFSTWASRIPTIKAAFDFNDAELATVLVFLPIGSLLGLPTSGWLVSRFDSRVPLMMAIVAVSIALTCIGLATSTVVLIVSVCCFAFGMRMLNISINTQSVALQKKFDRRISGSFHGLWSTGGIVGVGFCTLLIALDISIMMHTVIVSITTVLIAFFSYRYLLRNDRAVSENKIVLGKPDPYTLYLGLIVFFASLCEGGMFDWSGIYFKEIVKVELFTWGYLSFMIFMAFSRFASDGVIEKIGVERIFMISAICIFVGIVMSISYPSFWVALAGFCLVGYGCAAVMPVVISLAGASKKYSPGLAISIVISYNIAGVFVGPPLIGYIAQISSLRFSFIVFALSGLMFIPMSRLFFRHQRSLEP